LQLSSVTNKNSPMAIVKINLDNFIKFRFLLPTIIGFRLFRFC
jgi:hypothetical protein